MNPRPRSISRRRALSVLGAAPLAAAAGPRAHAATEFPYLPESDVLVLRPGDPDFDTLQRSYNSRTERQPRWRAMCRTATGLRRVIDAAREKDIPFAIRSGGHSFEGFSQSGSLVIDVRSLNRIVFDPSAPALVVGSGVSLGDVYRAAAKTGHSFPGGSCPTVGIAGHMQGGGFGLFARAQGLACDALLGAEIVDAQGALSVVSAAQDPDLFWALRGGGGGTFGAAASFHIALFPVDHVHTFAHTFLLPLAAAVQVIDAWQNWAPNLPDEISSLLTLRSTARGLISIRLAGQSVGDATALKSELRAFAGKASQSLDATIRSGSALQAVDRFSGGWKYESKFSKGKSDYVMSPLSHQAIDTLLQRMENLPPNRIIAILDAYGGAIRHRRPADTAFAFRDALFSMQYYTSWLDPGQTPVRLAQMRSVYDAMRPYLPGFSYVNYCDLDLQDWRRAYWGENAGRLQAIKAHVDPRNLFRHAQSITPA